MSVQDGYIEYEEEGQDEFGDDSLKGLRKQAAKAKKLEAEMWEMHRELAFARSGLPLDDPALQYFIRGYDGDLDTDEILEAAADAGFIEFVDDDDESDAPEYNPAMDAQSRVMNAAAGGAAENTTEAAALARMQEALHEGGVEAFTAVAQEFGIPVNNDE